MVKIIALETPRKLANTEATVAAAPKRPSGAGGNGLPDSHQTAKTHRAPNHGHNLSIRRLLIGRDRSMQLTSGSPRIQCCFECPPSRVATVASPFSVYCHIHQQTGIQEIKQFV